MSTSRVRIKDKHPEALDAMACEVNFVWMRWRVARGARKSLGWIPFKVGAVTYKSGQLRYAGQFFSLGESCGLADYKLRSGGFNQDARSRWYTNLCVEVEQQKSEGTSSLGIDLGLKDFATLSTGEKIDAQGIYHGAEQALAVAQRVNKKQRVKGDSRANSKRQERLPAQTQHPARS